MGGIKETVHVRATIDSPPEQQSLQKQPRGPRCKKAETGDYRPIMTLWKVYKSQVQTKPVAHLAWKKGVCCGRAAFDITFQHKTTLSLNTLAFGHF